MSSINHSEDENISLSNSNDSISLSSDPEKGSDEKKGNISNTKKVSKQKTAQLPVRVDSNEIPRTPSNTPYSTINGIKEKPVNVDTEAEYYPNIEENDINETLQKLVTVFELLNAQLGAGILSVPSTFINTGIIPSIILLLLIMLLSYACTAIVIVLAKKKHTENLQELTESILKKPGSILLTILNLVFLNACMTAYLILGGDMITSWFDIGGIDISTRFRHAIMIFIYALCVPVMLTIPRSNKVLEYVSYATVVSVLYFVIVLVYKCAHYCTKMQKINPTCRLWKVDMSIFSSLSIYGLAFALPAVVLPAIKEYNAGVKKRKFASFLGVFVCFLLVVISGFTGYFIFGDQTDGNILKSFNSKDILIIICRVAFFVIVSCIYPMFSASAIPLWSNAIFKETDPNKNLFGWKRSVIIIINSIIPVILAMFLPTAKPIFSIGGAFGGCIVNFIFPCLMFIVYKWEREKWYCPLFLILYLCILFGAVTCIFSTYQAVLDAIESLKHVKN